MDDLILDDRNANRGTKRGRELLAESLKVHGAGRSILADRFGRVIAGNKTLEQAKALGLPIRVINTDGRVLVVVQRQDLDLRTDETARALAIKDNRIAELDLDWDPQLLGELRAQGLELADLWTEKEWAELTGVDHVEDPSENQVLEPGATTIRRGDLFALGPHRLLCGDATDVGDVSRLLETATPAVMLTDPPYGVDYDPAERHRAYPSQRTAVGRVMNDHRADWSAAFRLFTGDVVYAWHAGVRSAVACGALESAGFLVRSQIIWVKQHFALSRSNYHHQHEPCFYAVRRGSSAHWRGDRTQSTVWSVPNLNPMGGQRNHENAPTGHGTQKPVRLFEIPILNHTARGESVFDPFVGSGSTLIAAEKTGRVAYAMDLDPRYVQVAVSRWESFTGRRAKQVGPTSRRRK